MIHATKNILRVLLGVPLTVVSLLFVINFIYSNRLEVLPYLKNFNILGVGVGMIFLSLFFVARSFVWREIMAIEGYRISARKATYLLAISELKRYIPGSILALASRIHNFSENKIPAKTVLRMIFYESILFVATSFLASIPALLFLADKYNISREVLYIAALFLIAIFLITYFSTKLSKKTKQVFKYSNAFSMMTAAWLCFGIGNYLILTSFYFLDPRKIVEIASLAVLAWLIGYAAIIAPLGLGIREAFLTYSLSFFAPLGISAALAIIARAAFTLIEIVFLFALFLLNKIVKSLPKIQSTVVLLWASIFSYIAYFTYYSFEKYNNFFTGRFDLGNMDQTVWNTLHGRFFQLTNPDGVATISRLAFHSDFILIALSPFYLLWQDPRMLLLIQTIVIAGGAYFIYKIAELVLENRYISLVFAVSYLLNPFVEKQNLFDFHAVALATTFLLAFFYFMLKKNYLWMTFALILAVLCKEEVFGVAGILLLYLFHKTCNMKWIFASVVSFTLFYLIIAKFIPDARGGQHFAVEYFQDFGDKPSSIIKNLILNPVKTSESLFTLSNFSYIFKLTLPTGFISFFAPLSLIFSFPDLIINLISKNENLKSLTFHYAATIIPFVYISSIYGAARLLRIKSKFLNIRTLSIFILATSTISTYFYGTLPGSKNPSLEIYTDRLENAKQIQKFLSRIPQKLSIAASNNLGSHLSHRENIYTVPYGIDRAHVIVLLLNDNFAQPSLETQKNLAFKLRHDSKYSLVFETGDFIAFSKKDIRFYFR